MSLIIAGSWIVAFAAAYGVAHYGGILLGRAIDAVDRWNAERRGRRWVNPQAWQR